jgi:glycosyltransferase involved in cell wall biosynthesis
VDGEKCGAHQFCRALDLRDLEPLAIERRKEVPMPVSLVRNVLIIVENLPVPLDRRVWQQATALVRAGFRVSVICPKTGKHTLAFEELEGVQIYRHSLPVKGSGVFRYLLEYIWAWFAELFLTIKVFYRQRADVIQACNPPDNIFLIGITFRLIFGTIFIFDHHDPFGELFALKFPRQVILQRIVNWFERRSLRSADRVITTSEQLRRLATDHHDVEPDRIALVRSGFDLRRMPQVSGDPDLKRGRRYMALYLGVMGEQDGIDVLLEAISIVVHRLGRQDIQFTLAGDGDQRVLMQKLTGRLGLSAYVEFTGYVEGAALYRLLATADIGLSPDPKNEFNDKLSMNKILEYMAFELPIVQFDLNEGRVLADEAAIYAKDNSPEQFALAITGLIDDPSMRAKMGKLGAARIGEMFSWDRQEEIYIDVYKSLAEG